MDAGEAAAVIAELEAQAVDWFDEEGVTEADRQTSPVALMRYHGQGGEIAVPFARTREAAEENFRASAQVALRLHPRGRD